MNNLETPILREAERVSDVAKPPARQVVTLDTTNTNTYSWSNTGYFTTTSAVVYSMTDAVAAPGWLGEMRGLLLHPTAPYIYVSIVCIKLVL